MELMKGYKQTEVGVIPEDWEVNNLNDVSRITRLAGYEYSSMWEETVNGEIIALRGFNIGKNQIIEKDFVRISNKLSLKLNRSRLYKGNIVYPCVGTIGNAVVIEEDDKYHIQQNIAKIIPDNNIIDSYFLTHYLMSFLGLNEINRFNGTSSQPNILVSSLRKYLIVLPHKNEQTAIATALSDTDALIQSLEKLTDKKRAIKQGAMQELLTGKRRLSGFESESNSFVHTEIGVIPSDWELKRLSKLLKAAPSYGINAAAVELKNNLPMYIRITDISDEGYFAPTVKVGVDHPMANNYFLDEGDIVFARTGASVGKSYLYNCKDGKLVYAGFLIKMSSDENKLLPAYLFHYVKTQTYWNWVKVMSMRSGQPGINGAEYGQLLIPLPTIEEQTAIASILSDMDAEITALETKLAKYKQIKQGMMQNLLTGRIRLI